MRREWLEVRYVRELLPQRLQAADDVWAVGDIAEYDSVVHSRRIRIEHWDVALNQGSYVGRAWAGKDQGPYDVVPYFFSDLADWTWMEYVGPAGHDDDVLRHERREEADEEADEHDGVEEGQRPLERERERVHGGHEQEGNLH